MKASGSIIKNMKKKNPLAVALGQMRAEKQFKGWTKEQISTHMRGISLKRIGNKSRIADVDIEIV